jgi:hypothetical protein
MQSRPDGPSRQRGSDRSVGEVGEVSENPTPPTDYRSVDSCPFFWMAL